MVQRAPTKAEEELKAFRDFVHAAKLGVLSESIQKRSPPEPDVRCQLSDGSVLAFELVEVCHPQIARWYKSVELISAILEQAYQGLPRRLKTQFDSRFAGKPLSFLFADDCSLNKLRNMLPRVFAELIDQVDREGEFSDFSSVIQKGVISVRLAGRVEDSSRPSFNIAGRMRPDVDDLLMQRVHSKLSRRYETRHPIELLAYFAGRAWEWDRSANWRTRLENLLIVRGSAPFRRVWVFGSTIQFVYPKWRS